MTGIRSALLGATALLTIIIIVAISGYSTKNNSKRSEGQIETRAEQGNIKEDAQDRVGREAYEGYVHQIDELPQLAVTVTSGEYPIAEAKFQLSINKNNMDVC